MPAAGLASIMPRSTHQTSILRVWAKRPVGALLEPAVGHAVEHAHDVGPGQARERPRPVELHEVAAQAVVDIAPGAQPRLGVAA